MLNSVRPYFIEIRPDGIKIFTNSGQSLNFKRIYQVGNYSFINILCIIMQYELLIVKLTHQWHYV